MAPGFVIDQTCNGGADSSKTTETSPILYNNIDSDALQKKASQYLGHFGVEFARDIICGSKGVYIYTASGRKVLDWTSGLSLYLPGLPQPKSAALSARNTELIVHAGQMSCLLGHGHEEIVHTITKHAAGLDHLFSGMISPPVISLAERLCSLLPEGLDKAFFLSTGGESNEAAIKMAKVFTGKFEIVGLGGSWQ